MLTTNELARKLDLPRQTLVKAIAASYLKPDAEAARSMLFRYERLHEIAQTLCAVYEERLQKVVSAVKAPDPSRLRAFLDRYQAPPSRNVASNSTG